MNHIQMTNNKNDAKSKKKNRDLRAGIRLKYLPYRHFFRTSQVSQKMRYRVQILGT